MLPLGDIGGIDEDRARLDQLRGATTTDGWLIRSSSSRNPRLDSLHVRSRDVRVCGLRWAPLAPRADVWWNSALPYERNDGGVWEGRGTSLHAIAGIRGACGMVRFQVAPEVWYAQNRRFLPVNVFVPTRSGFTNPFFSAPTWSTDLPLRFGIRPLRVIEPGQSSLEIAPSRFAVGVATEAQWWGPALRNPLLMSNHAPGIPSVYIRTAAPVKTPIGLAEARMTVGALTESPFFDFDATNDLRSLSALIFTVRTRADSNLTVGAGRVVYAPISGIGALPARFFDALARWGEGGNLRTASYGRAAEQLISVFGRWVFPESGFEAYGEWGRVLMPASFRSLLVAPQYSQGYTVGLQWISGPLTAAAWRTQFELTDLEQPYESRAINPPTFYVSPSVPQGYTQRGQIIGAAIGPGSSSQFVAVDRMGRDGTIGVFLERVRWTDDAFFRAPTGLSVWAHDVSLRAGTRGARDIGALHLSAELVAETRLNYLFQSATIGFAEDRTFDVNNVSLAMSLSPRSR